MRENDLVVCNVCGIKSTEDENAVFVKAHKNKEEVDICTNCIPSVIHGSGNVVRSNEQTKADL
ncbi:hypothetical protein BB381_00565 [Campylobacter pinnipediorum subsp. caledonicus]|uniref:hypothetical protein n=1 Tax=Campylobacter pinnipediorum TaxID=1965231 RepID=UPI000994AC83|nr:hypothetical protein [Campylobacter pinnipediorum]OPA72078.1 hypothetical protein BB381_00565 [Campylobacter pinnipediorum subsp. caledonicus]